MNVLKLIFLLIFLFVFKPTFAQFTIDASLRPRFEYRHGYKTLFPENEKPATFVSQRTRLNFGYKNEDLHFYLSTQDVRVWGEIPQTNAPNDTGLSIHQAWGEAFINPSISFKIGRQEIKYDDQRILGVGNWGQKSRSHDAALFKYVPTFIELHIGVAYNQDKEALTGNIFSGNNYKSLQYLWAHKKWKNINASFLFLNNGMQYINELETTKNETRYSQTTGFHLVSKISNFNIESNLFYQFGKDIADNSINAYLFSVQGKYSPNNQFKFGLGGEILSGNDYGAPSNGKNNAFNPIYGSSHSFNGSMDYFYAGDHRNNVGLIDLSGNTSYSFNSKSAILLNFHKFIAASKIDSDISKDLGFEIDLVTSYTLNKYVNANVGYSHFFTSKGIEIVKNNYDGNSNNWAWLMISINPELFNWQPNNTKNN